MDYDVVVAGGGPVGLMLACELRLRGVTVLVLERQARHKQVAEDQRNGVRALNVPTVEAFDRRGLLPAMRASQERAVQLFEAGRGEDEPHLLGHFAFIFVPADRFDGSGSEFAGRTEVGGTGFVGTDDILRVLATRAEELGADVRWASPVTGFEADAEGVTVASGETRLRAGWLVGCDGAHSQVRRMAGFDFPGVEPEFTTRQALVDLAEPDLLPGGGASDAGFFMHAEVADHVHVVGSTEFDHPRVDTEVPVTAEEVQASLRRVSGVDVTITSVVVASRYTDTTRQASTYRLGRVLLAGDAAHVHPPFGGQGLNLGIGDAVNLGWKLAATIAGWAPEALLDSYTAERHPIGAWVQDWTMAQTALLRPEPRARALHRVVSDLLETGAGATYVVRMISGVWQRYDLPGAHPLVGAAAPDLLLDDGSRIADHCHDGRPLLIDLAGRGHGGIATGWGGRLHLMRSGCARRPDLSGLLVRPDGYVAWAAGEEPDEDGLAAALRTWLGTPEPDPAATT